MIVSRGTRQPGAARLAPLWVGVALVLALAPQALAQSNDVRALVDRVERLQRDLTVLQRAVYRGEKPPSDAVAAAQGASPSRVAATEIRLTSFETELQRLTGQVETFDHRLRQINQRLDKLIGDVDFRLKELEHAASRGPASGGPMSETNADGGPARTELSDTTQGGGTLAAAAQAPAQVASAPAVLPVGTPMEKYNYAFSLLRKKDVEQAQHAFQEFIASHGEDRLAANAQYWLGETFYVRERYKEAAIAFNEGYRRFPDSSKAADTLLKLSITLRSLGENSEACAALAELKRRFPKANPSLLSKADAERNRAGCR